MAEVASLGHHPTIQGLGCLEMGADAAKIVNISFPLHYPDPCQHGQDGEFWSETLTEEWLQNVQGKNNLSVGFSRFIHWSLTLNLRNK